MTPPLPPAPAGTPGPITLMCVSAASLSVIATPEARPYVALASPRDVPICSPMNFRSNHVSTSLAKVGDLSTIAVSLLTNFNRQNYGAHVPKGFTVRIFKAPALSSLPSTAEARFDLGYHSQTSKNTWPKPGWTSGLEKTSSSLAICLHGPFEPLAT